MTLLTRPWASLPAADSTTSFCTSMTPTFGMAVWAAAGSAAAPTIRTIVQSFMLSPRSRPRRACPPLRFVSRKRGRISEGRADREIEPALLLLEPLDREVVLVERLDRVQVPRINEA